MLQNAPAFAPRPRSLTSVREARPTCYACIRPLTHCVCQFIEPFSAHCNLLLLQHPHERKKYCSTTKLVLRAIENCTLKRCIELSETELHALGAGSSATYLLYPGPEAAPCESAVLDQQSTVIVIDGTWDEAQKIVYRNRLTERFPCLSFQQSFRSNYRIRKQPKEHCLSTIESIGYLLKLNAEAHGRSELSRTYDRLFAGFQKMVEQQLDYEPRTRRSS